LWQVTAAYLTVINTIYGMPCIIVFHITMRVYAGKRSDAGYSNIHDMLE